MNPAISDDIDKALVSSIAQEMVLCRKSLLEFATLSHRSRIQRPNQATTLEANLAYSRFLCHLYEFYLGCISRTRKSTSPLDHVRADDAISLEARKQLNQARILIRKGLLPRLPDNTLYAIQTKDVPQNFGMHFRLFRNRMSHASIERYKPIKAPALKYIFGAPRKIATGLDSVRY